MALRIKSHWHDADAERRPDELGGALAFISWRLAKDKAINLHGQDFVYEDDRQRLDVIVEYLVFQLQIVDRLAHLRYDLNVDQRRALIGALARKLAEHLQDNSEDLLGPGDYVKPFVDKINERGADYSELDYTETGPSYPFMRHLGYEIQQVMGSEGENRWVIDQVMDQDGIDVHIQLKRAMDNLFS